MSRLVVSAILVTASLGLVACNGGSDPQSSSASAAPSSSSSTTSTPLSTNVVPAHSLSSSSTTELVSCVLPLLGKQGNAVIRGMDCITAQSIWTAFLEKEQDSIESLEHEGESWTCAILHGKKPAGTCSNEDNSRSLLVTLDGI